MATLNACSTLPPLPCDCDLTFLFFVVISFGSNFFFCSFGIAGHGFGLFLFGNTSRGWEIVEDAAVRDPRLLLEDFRDAQDFQ